MNNLLLTINPVAARFLGIEVRWYGIIIATGVLLAVVMAMVEAKKRQIMPDDIIDLLLWCVPIGFIGARIYYVVFEWGYYQHHLNEIFAIWNGGIAIYGGLLAGLVTILIFSYYKMLPFWLLLDIITPGVLAAQVMGRFGNFINQEAFGAKTSLGFLQSLHLPHFMIEQMFIDGAYRQPTFLYESFFNLIGLVLILSLRHRQHLFKVGEVTLSYVIWYSVVRFFVEGMRTDSLYAFGVIRVSQALSLVLLVAAVSIWIYRRRVVKPKWYLEGSGKKFPY